LRGCATKGWLERFDAGTTLAVRVDPDGVVGIDPLPEPPAIDPDLVAALLAAYHRMADEPELPVSGEDLVFALLAEDRDAFREPRAPLDALCGAAGLERRASAVAHDPAFWTNQTWLQRAGRIHAAAHGDEELAHDALAVLDLADLADLADAADDDRDQVQAALDALDEIEVISLVADEPFDEDTWFERAEHAAALVERLLGLARRPASARRPTTWRPEPPRGTATWRPPNGTSSWPSMPTPTTCSPSTGSPGARATGAMPPAPSGCGDAARRPTRSPSTLPPSNRSPPRPTVPAWAATSPAGAARAASTSSATSAWSLALSWPTGSAGCTARRPAT
jgi:hypothetical protein